MGRKLRNTIPTFHTNLTQVGRTLKSCEKERQRAKKSRGPTPISDRQRVVASKLLQPGVPVYTKGAETTGTVTGAAGTLRSYMINTKKGTVRRNRSHLVPIPSDKSETPLTSIQRSPDKAPTPVKPLLPPCISSRPKRPIRPSLKLRESLGLD